MMVSIDTAYCYHCRKVANLMESITLKFLTGRDEKKERIVLKAYHCESCCSFVRSCEDGSFLSFAD